MKAPTFRNRSSNPLGVDFIKNLMEKKQEASQIADVQSKGGVEVGRKIGGSTFKFPEAAQFTADAMNRSNQLKSIDLMMKDLEEMSNKLPAGRFGPGGIQWLQSKISGGEGETGSNIKLYTDNMPTAAVSLYRFISGDNRLSDADAKARALPLMWHPTESALLRTKKNNFLKRAVEIRKNQIHNGQLEGTPENFNNILAQTNSKSIQPPDNMVNNKNQNNDPLGLFS